jgi:hypothetical protein
MKRKAAQSKQRSRKHSAKSSSALEEVGQGIVYEEVTGKTIDFIRYAEHSDWPAFEIRFTDGTFLFIEPVPRVEFRVRLLKATEGNVRALREYGITGH